MSGIGLLKVYFESDTDIGAAVAQLSSTSLTVLKLLPPSITPPTVLQYNAANVPVAQPGAAAACCHAWIRGITGGSYALLRHQSGS